MEHLVVKFDGPGDPVRNLLRGNLAVANAFLFLSGQWSFVKFIKDEIYVKEVLPGLADVYPREHSALKTIYPQLQRFATKHMCSYRRCMRYRPEMKRIFGACALNCRLCKHFIIMYSIFFHRTSTTYGCFKAFGIVHSRVGLLCTEDAFTIWMENAVGV